MKKRRIQQIQSILRDKVKRYGRDKAQVVLKKIHK